LSKNGYFVDGELRSLEKKTKKNSKEKKYYLFVLEIQKRNKKNIYSSHNFKNLR